MLGLDAFRFGAVPDRVLTFFGIYLGRGRPSRSEVFTLELFPGGRPSSRNSQDGTESELEACLRLFSSTQDHDQEDRRTLADIPVLIRTSTLTSLWWWARTETGRSTSIANLAVR